MRIIAHLDMDAFFASVEERDNPRLAGRPIVVGSDPEGGKGRGVVSTANYLARAYGIRSALPISHAWRYSESARRRGFPPAVFMEVNMEKYSEVSRSIMTIVREILRTASGKNPMIEQASVDEAYMDLSFADSYERAAEIAHIMKTAIRDRERLTASIGIGPNKLIAKIASDFQKPDGLTVVREEDAEHFIEPMSLRVIPGIGPKTQKEFEAQGVRTVHDAKAFSEPQLYEMIGKWGLELYEKLRGRSTAPIEEGGEVKSISEQETFPQDVSILTANNKKILTGVLAGLSADVHSRFLADCAVGAGFHSFRSVGIAVRFADFTTKTRMVTLPDPIAASNPQGKSVIEFQSLRLFMPFLDRRENPAKKSIRLLGVKIERFQ